MHDRVTARVDDRPGRAAAGIGRSDTLMAGITRLIECERLAPGRWLPTVQSLATHFSVAPPTVLEAMRRLQATGLWSCGADSGPAFARVSRASCSGTPCLARLEAGTMRDLLDARILIEPHAAGPRGDTRIAPPRHASIRSCTRPPRCGGGTIGPEELT